MDSALRKVVRRGHLCPRCGLAMLKMVQVEGDEHVACVSCAIEYRSFKTLFADVAKDQNRTEDSWERWLSWNDDYDGER